MSISRLAGWLVPAVTRWASAVEVAREMVRYGVGTIVVTEDDRPIGTLTERDLVRCVVSKGYGPRESLAGDLLLCAAAVDAPVREVPVFDGKGGITGVVTFSDLCNRDARRAGSVLRRPLASPASDGWQSFE